MKKNEWRRLKRYGKGPTLMIWLGSKKDLNKFFKSVSSLKKSKVI